MLDYLSFEADFNNVDAVSAYDELPLWSSFAGQLMLKHLPLRGGARVLDVGCGTGFPLLELAGRLGPESTLTGIDPWAPALERARAKARTYGLTNVDIRDGDAATMPFAAASFDLIVSNLGVNNFSDAPSALRECRRVITDTGILALTTNLQGHMRELYEVFAATLSEMSERGRLPALQRHVEHRATVAGTEALLASAGFHVTRVEQESATMRYADGSALLRHYFIKLGFLGAWKEIVPDAIRPAVFGLIETRLNELAASNGGIALTIPLAYIEGTPVHGGGVT
jgi:ubiquinone/menaquinone biosynthesis C-methylase UbiE